MNMPGFTAEASLEGVRQGSWGVAGTAVKACVVPQLLYVPPEWQLILDAPRCPVGCVETGNPFRPCYCGPVVTVDVSS
jgi:hypothetical protein